MKLVFCLFFLVTVNVGYTQIARLTFSDEQKFRVNINQGGLAGANPFAKAFRTVHIDAIVPDNENGYMKFTVLKGRVGSTKYGPYVHFMKLDNKLRIKSEKEVYLLSENSENIEPVTYFVKDNNLFLVTAGSDKTMSNINLAYWIFDMSTISFVKSNISFASFPFTKNKEYYFTLHKTKDLKAFFGLIIREEGGKKEQSILHCVSFNENMIPNFKRSITLPFLGKKGPIGKIEGPIARIVISQKGTIYALLHSPEEKRRVDGESHYGGIKRKEQVILLEHKNEPVINVAIGLLQNDELLISGLTWPSKKGYCEGLIISKIGSEMKLEILKEEIFSEALLDDISHADKDGIKDDYYVRSISERQSGIIDIILNYCVQGSGSNSPSGSQGSGYTKIFDVLILSFEKNKLASVIPIKRNLEYNSSYGSHIINPQNFSVPEVFTVENDLYLMYFDNPSNFIGTNKKRMKFDEFKNGTFVLAKIDENYKTTRQEMIQFENKGNFSSFYDLDVDEIDNKNYILTSNKYRPLTKNVKTSSVLVNIN